ncbi:hypothetical protein, partial [Microbacterium sp. LM3X-1.2]
TIQRSIKGKTNVSTSTTSMQKLKERARKRREAAEASKTLDLEKVNSEPKKSDVSKKKKMDMDFFLGRK